MDPKKYRVAENPTKRLIDLPEGRKHVRVVIQGTGNILIGTTTDLGARLQVPSSSPGYITPVVRRGPSLFTRIRRKIAGWLDDLADWVRGYDRFDDYY